MNSVPVAIALGSNLGDRAAHLEYGFDRLQSILTGFQRSTVRESEPWGVAPQPAFLNAVAIGATSVPPSDLLATLLRIEAERGRTRPGPGQARTLDLDLILYGDRVIDEPGLQVPHPRFRERPFVLEPLAEIAGEWIDPVTGLSMNHLLTHVFKA